MRIPELLSPAGSPEALRAAVNSGADAVYLGYSAFGARASAANFDLESLNQGIRFAHLHGVRIYVTVNTLIKPEECAAVGEALRIIDEAGADAVIVQDLGVAGMVRDSFPRLSLHASTQMAICNATGARTAGAFGFDRVVLARECTLPEIRKVTSTGMDTEVFVHGALCTAVSGRCLMSSMAGGRSGNRGRCAQPCRQMFSMEGQQGALLSLRDLCLYRELPLLCEAGVSSLKIEGRLKSPEYVAGVTAEYRKALDSIANGKNAAASADGLENLLQLFNRGGFTKGHAMEQEDADLTTGDHVSHEGIPVGRVERISGQFAFIRLSHEIANDDSLQIRGKHVFDFRYSGPDCAAGTTAKAFLRAPDERLAGAPVYRLTSARLQAALSQIGEPVVPLAFHAAFRRETLAELTVSDGRCTVTVQGNVPAPAQSRPATQSDVLKQLGKLGGTQYALREAEIRLEEGLFLPVGELNALRRTALDGLEKTVQQQVRSGRSSQVCVSPAISRPSVPVDQNSLFVITPEAGLVSKLKSCGADHVVFAPSSLLTEDLEKAFSAFSEPVWFRLPPQMTEGTLSGLISTLEQHRSKLLGLWLESFGQLTLMPALPAIAGEGIPVTNPGAEAFLAGSALSACCHWPEWTEKEGPYGLKTPLLLKMYGRQILMLLSHCPKRVALGLSSGRSGCTLCDEPEMACGIRNPEMTDRMGYRFPLLRTRFPEGCELSVLGALPTDLRLRVPQRRNRGILLHFTDEPASKQLELTRLFSDAKSGKTILPASEDATNGHWLHGVE